MRMMFLTMEEAHLTTKKVATTSEQNEFHDDQSTVVDSSLVTPRPSIGTKKTKLMDFAERHHLATTSACNIATSTTNTMKKVEFCFTPEILRLDQPRIVLVQNLCTCFFRNDGNKPPIQ
jgi:hypothetical protein